MHSTPPAYTVLSTLSNPPIQYLQYTSINMKWPSFIPRNKFDTGGHYRFSTDADAEKAGTVDSPVPFLTWRSFFLGAFVSIGGIIFGYDTGQISGFLEMDNFKRRFGQLQSDGTWKFSNVRSGLIVAMVRPYPIC